MTSLIFRIILKMHEFVFFIDIRNYMLITKCWGKCKTWVSIICYWYMYIYLMCEQMFKILWLEQVHLKKLFFFKSGRIFFTTWNMKSIIPDKYTLITIFINMCILNVIHMPVINLILFYWISWNFKHHLIKVLSYFFCS